LGIEVAQKAFNFEQTRQRDSSVVIYPGNDSLMAKFLCKGPAYSTPRVSINAQLKTSPNIPQELQGRSLDLLVHPMQNQAIICRSIARDIAQLHYDDLINRTSAHSAEPTQTRIVIKNSFFVPCMAGEPATLDHEVWLPTGASQGKVTRNEDKLRDICARAYKEVQHHAYWIATAIIEDKNTPGNPEVQQIAKICLIADEPYRLGDGILPILCPGPITLASVLGKPEQKNELQNILTAGGFEAYKIDLWRKAKGYGLLKTYSELGDPALQYSPIAELWRILNLKFNPVKRKPR
jgi:hypothetical protein